MACYPAGGPPWTNQEYHQGSGITGSLSDYKHGPAGAGNKDPTAVIGTYTVAGVGGGQVTYSYTAGGSFVYTVWGTQSSGSGTYDFCNGTTPLPGRVKVIAQVGGSPISCG